MTDEEISTAAQVERAVEMLRCAGIPPRFTKDNLLEHMRHEGWKGCFAAAHQKVCTRGDGHVVILCGDRGTGKTTMACELVRMVICRELFYATYSTLEDYLVGIQKRDPDWEHIVGWYHDPRVIVLDEVGKSTDGSWTEQKLFALVNRRFNDNKHTILCSAAAPDDLAGVLSPSILDRSNEGGAVIHLNWPSFRSAK